MVIARGLVLLLGRMRRHQEVGSKGWRYPTGALSGGPTSPTPATLTVAHTANVGGLVKQARIATTPFKRLTISRCCDIYQQLAVILTIQ